MRKTILGINSDHPNKTLIEVKAFNCIYLHNAKITTKRVQTQTHIDIYGSCTFHASYVSKYKNNTLTSKPSFSTLQMGINLFFQEQRG